MMNIKHLLHTFKRSFDRRGLYIYIITVLFCSFVSILYASMCHVDNTNYMLLALCGGLKEKSDYAVLFSLWMIPSIMTAFLSGQALDSELNGYKYIALRYGNRRKWLLYNILNILVESFLRSMLLLIIGVVSCDFLYGGDGFESLSSALLGFEGRSFQYWISDKCILTELLVMTTIRFTRIGLIMMSSRLLPKNNAQVGMIVVVLIEALTFVNGTISIPLYTYFSACSIGISLLFALIIGVAETLCIVGMIVMLFRIAIQKGQV